MTTTVSQVTTPQLIIGDTWRFQVTFADANGPVPITAQGFVPSAIVTQASAGLTATLVGRDAIIVDDPNGVVDFVVRPDRFASFLRTRNPAGTPASFRFIAYLTDQFGARQTYVAQDYAPVDLTTADLSKVVLAPIGVALVVPLVAQTYPVDPPSDPTYGGESGGTPAPNRINSQDGGYF